MDSESLFEALGSEDFKYSSDGDSFMTNCPFAAFTHSSGTDHNPSFRFNTETGNGKCYSCGKHGSIGSILFELSVLNPSNRKTYLKLMGNTDELFSEDTKLDKLINNLGNKKTSSDYIVPFPESYLDAFEPAENNNASRWYLMDRGLSLDNIKELNFKYDPDNLRVAMPVRGSDGVLYGLHGRSIDPDVEKKFKHYAYGHDGHRNTHVWVNEHNVDFDEPVVVCEGIFDVASIHRVYPNVMGSMSTNITPSRMETLTKASLIVTFYDNGEAGDHARESISERFKNVHHIRCGDDYDDPGEMPITEIETRLETYL